MDIDRELDRMAAEFMGLPTDGQARKTLPLFDLSALAGEPPANRKWAVPDFIPANEVTLFTGPGGSGKSLLAQQLATCLAAGLPFLGMPLNAAATLYVTAEDDTDELHRRQRNIVATVGAGEMAGKLFLSSLRGRIGNELVLFDRDGEVQRTSTFHLLKDTIGQTGATFVVLDNLAHLFGGNENDRGQVTRFANALYSLRRDICLDYADRDLTILLIGHPNKNGDGYSGSTAWLNAVRSQIELIRPDETDLDARVLRLGKSNYARCGAEAKLRWHNFAFVAEADLPPDTFAEIAATAQASADNDIFLACLRLRNHQQRPVSESPASRTFAPRVFAEMAESKKIGRARLEAAMERLFRFKAIERGFVGRIDRKDKEGLRECAEVRADHALPPRADVRPQGAPSAPSHTLYTTYITGGGPDGPRPPDYDPERGGI